MVIRFGKNDTYRSFNNFYRSEVVWEGIMYTTSEAAFQAAKTLDINKRKEIASCVHPRAAKRMGRRVALREDWEDVKYDIMIEVLLCKFEQHKHLKATLLSTGDSLLVENTTSWHDNIWGVCQCQVCRDKVSLNQLGCALMEVRARLRGDNKCLMIADLMGKRLEFDLWNSETREALKTSEGREFFSDFFKYAE